jgi:serine/threonine protein kinase
VLLDFAAGQIEGSERREISDHVSACRRCTEALESLRSNLPSNINAELTGGSTTSGGPTVREHHEPETEFWENLDDDRFDCAILEPSSRQGALGRLGEYDILERVGHGGMGVVFKAFDERLQRTVAIKVMNRQLASSPTARRRFLREARAAAGINHPNVVTIHAVEEHSGYPVLVMEYIGGGTLREYIDEHGPLDPLEVIRLSREIAAGLAAAHAHGVIHRDIKPGNILLEGGAVRVIITDFGLARAAIDNVELTSQGHAVGTPAYMSPEQVKGEKLDLRSDLFSLGCVIYAMVSGHSPFRGTSSLQMARNVAELQPPLLHEIHEETPQALSEMVDRLLEKSPDDRCQSATEVAQVLGRYLEVLNLTPTDKMQATLKDLGPGEGGAGRRVPWKLATTLIVLLAVVVSMLVWRPWDRNRPDPGGGGKDSPLGPPLITVGESGQSDAQTLDEALEQAGRDTVIRLKDGQRFVDNLVISDPRLQGIHLEAGVGPRAERPTLAASDEAAPVIQIKGVSNVVIRGLRIEGSVRGAIAIDGRCGGVEIDNVECVMPDVETVDTLQPAVAIRASRLPGESGPVVLRNSRIETPALGRCVQVTGTTAGAPDVRLEDNRFSGRGVLVLAGAKSPASLGSLVIAGNLFIGRADSSQEQSDNWYTVNGVNLVLETLAPDQQVLINNNTFVNVRTWLGLVTSATDRVGVTVANNLILRSQGVKGGLDRLPAAADNWRFEGNWLEPALVVDEPRELQAQFATIHERIDVLNRDDPEHPDFALPPPGSPLFSGGCGEGLPEYVGARGPSDPGR